MINFEKINKMIDLIEESQIIKCGIYPDGTILISTGLFDYIEARYFLWA